MAHILVDDAKVINVVPGVPSQLVQLKVFPKPPPIIVYVLQARGSVGVGVKVGVILGVFVGVAVLVGVCVGVPVFVGVIEGVGVGDAVFDGVGVIPVPFL